MSDVYAAPADLLDRFRADVLADLLGLAVDPDADAAARTAAVAADPRVSVALADGSALVTAALTASRRYAPETLASLAGTSPPLLVRMTCEIAAALLWDQAQGHDPAAAAAARRHAETTLARLGRGEIVLPGGAHGAAGLTSAHTIGTLAGGGAAHPTLPERMRRYWPRR